MRRVFSNLTRTKNIHEILSQEGENKLVRVLGAFDLTMIGIGGIIGAGIFVLTGTIAANYTGPAIVISFLIAGTCSALAAFCYAELASMIPVSGSAYTYAYATLGELVAWIIGWDLLLEYLVGASAVAVGLSGYIVSFIEELFNIKLNLATTLSTFTFSQQGLETSGHVLNVPAALMALIVTLLLTMGIKESARFNSFIVGLKLIIVVVFIFASIPFLKPGNWSPFIPDNTGTFGAFGVSGIFQGATLVFFSYIGFDSVSTTAQESKNPQRDLPIGIILSLVVCTILYIFVSFVLTGLVPYSTLNVPNPISVGIRATGMVWLEILINIGAIAGLTSVLFVTMLSQPRILFSMSNDGLLPPIFSKVSKTSIPIFSTAVTGTMCAVLSAVFPIDFLGEMTSVGTLFAFFIVSISVTVLRVKQPHIQRRFKVPFGPYLIPLLSAALSLGLIATSTQQTIIRLFVWMLLGVIIYALYGYNHSKLRNADEIQITQNSSDSMKESKEDETFELSKI